MDNKIRELRKEHKVTQDELGLAVGVTRQTIISLENGKYNASLQLAHKIASYFSYLALRQSSTIPKNTDARFPKSFNAHQ